MPSTDLTYDGALDEVVADPEFAVDRPSGVYSEDLPTLQVTLRRQLGKGPT
ncbi:hypothetical protein [Micromonospora sp. NBC_01638]|uniref:hypothetical protein n=1 Tax=Micromonospora sp. NBC_01638 TaxID=2975982 RepID=UPI00386ECB04|nr:hypothetical protein OG811_30510 [Micromonospora sp. NBC_01638]